jgi:hypothetical protein
MPLALVIREQQGELVTAQARGHHLQDDIT